MICAKIGPGNVSFPPVFVGRATLSWVTTAFLIFSSFLFLPVVVFLEIVGSQSDSVGGKGSKKNLLFTRVSPSALRPSNKHFRSDFRLEKCSFSVRHGGKTAFQSIVPRFFLIRRDVRQTKDYFLDFLIFYTWPVVISSLPLAFFSRTFGKSDQALLVFGVRSNAYLSRNWKVQLLNGKRRDE